MPDLRVSRAPIDDDEVNAARQPSKLVGKCTALGNRPHCAVQVANLASVDTFLGLAEATTGCAADFDEDKLSGRAGIDRQQVDLVAADTHIARDDGPLQRAQMIDDGVLGGRASSLPLCCRHDRRR